MRIMRRHLSSTNNVEIRKKSRKIKQKLEGENCKYWLNVIFWKLFVWKFLSEIFLNENISQIGFVLLDVWSVSKYGVFSGSYFPAFGLNTERYEVSQFIISNPWKVPWNWIAFYQNSFVISPGLIYHLIRRDTGRLKNEAFTSNPIVSSKQ